MKDYIRTVTWKFRDISESYPQLKDKQIKITSPEDVYENFRFLFEGDTQEKFTTLWLNSANKVFGFEIVTVGTLNSALVHPREVFRSAVVASCANIILVHAHPSGNVEPSQSDIKITEQLVKAGEILEIKVYDHIIFGDGFTSFAQRGLL